jgi:hypothetical protein
MSANTEDAHEDGSDGWPPEIFLSAVPIEFICAFCMSVAKSPMRCNDDHVFCSSCITKWLETHDDCPTDRAPLSTRSLSVARIVANVTADLDVRCHSCCSSQAAPVTKKKSLSWLSWFFTKKEQGTNGKSTCAWTGKLSELRAHSRQCPHVPVRCIWEGCEVRVQSGDLACHMEMCEYRREACVYGCGEYRTLIDMRFHKKCCPLRKYARHKIGIRKINCSFLCRDILTLLVLFSWFLSVVYLVSLVYFACSQ